MSTSYLYDNGLPFDSLLANNLKKICDRVDMNKASLIIIDGGVGMGKTTLLTHILDYINCIRGLPVIEIAVTKGSGPQLGMGGVEFMKKLEQCYEKKLPAVGYDEAGDFSKRRATSGFNLMLNRTFETFRAFKCVVVVVLPNFNVLDGALFDNQIPRMLLHCKDRTKSQGDYAAYGLMEMQYLRYWMSKFKIKSQAFKMVTPNFYGHFKDLPPERAKELDVVCTGSKIKTLRKAQVKIEGLLSYPELAKKLDRSVVWVRKAVADLKIKHKRVVDKAKYFEPEVADILSEHLDTLEPVGRPSKEVIA